jgi:hypothetical protein
MYPVHSAWWIIWLAFLLLMLMPIGYGWRYRGWGPPYPSYIQRRRSQRAASYGSAGVNHAAWGWRGDLAWMFFLIAIFWLLWLVAARW